MATRVREKFKFSAHPDEALEGGLADDFDGTVQSYELKDWTYPNGTIETSVLMLTISQDKPEGEPIEQPYGFGGKPGDWEYSADGQDLMSGPKAAFDKRSGAHRLMLELANAGVDPEQMRDGTNYSWLTGYKFHWKRRERTDVPLTNQAPRTDGRPARIPSDLLPTKLISAPRGATRGRAAAAPKATPGRAAAAPAPSEDGVSPEQLELVASVLTKRGPTPKMRLPSLILNWREGNWAEVSKQPTRAATAKVVVIDEMVANGMLVEDEKGTISLPVEE